MQAKMLKKMNGTDPFHLAFQAKVLDLVISLPSYVCVLMSCLETGWLTVMSWNSHTNILYSKEEKSLRLHFICTSFETVNNLMPLT